MPYCFIVSKANCWLACASSKVSDTTVFAAGGAAFAGATKASTIPATIAAVAPSATTIFRRLRVVTRAGVELTESICVVLFATMSFEDSECELLSMSAPQGVAGDVGDELNSGPGSVEQLDLPVGAYRHDHQVRDVLPRLEVQVRGLLLCGAGRPHGDESGSHRVSDRDVDRHRGDAGDRNATLPGDLEGDGALSRDRAGCTEVGPGVQDPGRSQRGESARLGGGSTEDVSGDVGQQLHRAGRSVEQLDLSVGTHWHDHQVRDALARLEVQVRGLLLRGARRPHG